MVNFLNAVVPGTVVKIPSLLSRTQADVACKHISDVQALLGTNKAPLAAAIQECVDIKSPYKIRPLFDECLTAYRAELYKDIKDPFHRLTLHEAVMAAGFYYHALAASQAGAPTENRRFVVNHYNFDARRDRILTDGVHKAVLSKEHTPAEDKLLTDLLQLERRLFGDFRMVPVSGTQYLCLGLPCSEITNETELHRILDYPIIRENGAFGTREEEGCQSTTKKTKVADRWKKTTVFSKVESDLEIMTLPSTFERATPEEKSFTVTTLLPAPPLTWRERVREAFLRGFVIVFAVWLSIWFVDEELATLIVLLVMKYKQTKNLREEAERSDSKLYLAQAGGNRSGVAPKY